MTGSKRACLNWLEQAPDDKQYKVETVRASRTMTQNKYYWKLVSELAGVLRVSNSELHFQMLKRYSTPEPFATFDYVDVSHFMRYYEERNRDGDVIYYLFYKGSSEMDTKEFTRLLDGLISECQEVGIPTETPEQIALMRRE